MHHCGGEGPPASPERGRKTTSSTARSASSFEEAGHWMGPVTDARQQVPPWLHCAEPSARLSRPRSQRSMLRGAGVGGREPRHDSCQIGWRKQGLPTVQLT